MSKKEETPNLTRTLQIAIAALRDISNMGETDPQAAKRAVRAIDEMKLRVN